MRHAGSRGLLAVPAQLLTSIASAGVVSALPRIAELRRETARQRLRRTGLVYPDFPTAQLVLVIIMLAVVDCRASNHGSLSWSDRHL